MAIQFPKTRKIVTDRAKADVQSALATSNPFLKNSFLGALVSGFSGRNFEFYLQLENALLEMFPHTAEGDYLARWGSYVNIIRNASTQATGQVVLDGPIPGGVIPAGTLLASSDSLTYRTQSEGTITTIWQYLLSVTRSGSLVTVTTTAAHAYATGQSVTIFDLVQTEYNGIHVISVTSETSFTYTIATTPTTPATGVGRAAADQFSALVIADAYGVGSNQVSGAQLTLVNPIAGVNSTAYVTYGEIGNGTDDEDDESFRDRILYRYQNPIALFNEASIKNEGFKQAGVTRIWVYGAGTDTGTLSVSSLTKNNWKATAVTTAPHYLEDGQYTTIDGASPASYNKKTKVLVINETTFVYLVDTAVADTATGGAITAKTTVPNGQVIIYFARDNDPSPIPTGSEVITFKDVILSIKPANASVEDVVVRAPTPITVDFSFTSISPNTTTMKAAVLESLQALFKEGTDVGVNLQDAAYISAIWQTVDATGAVVSDFALASPSGDVTVNPGELAILGAVTFA